jgi:hypothetical protein
MVRMKQWMAWCLVVAFGPAASFAADAPAPTMETTVVQGKSLKELRKDLKKAEDRVRDLYNELNQDSTQRVECREEASTGSRFTKRTCGTQAMSASTAEQVRQSLAEMSFRAGQASAAGGAVGSAPSAAAVGSTRVVGEANSGPVNVDSEQSAFQKNMEKLLVEHPELRQRLREYVEAKARLDAAEGKAGNKPPG